MEETAIPHADMKLRLAALAGLSTAALFVFTLAADKMRPFFINFSYYIIWSLVLAWTWVLVRYLRKTGFTLRGFLSKNKLGLALTLALTAVIFISVKPGWRVLSDDTNLLGTSRSLLFDHKPLNPTIGYYYYGNFQIKNSELDKRPLIFPFMANLLHLALGYHYWNVFVLNFLALWSLLFLFYRVFERYSGPPGGFAASLLVASYPIISLCATGGGFDLLSVLFLALSLLAVWLYLQTPEAEEQDLLFFTLLMFGNIRYESIIYLPIAFGLLLAWRRVPDGKRLLSTALFSAPLLLPTVWQRLLTMGHHEQPIGTSLFRVDSLVANAQALLKGQADFSLPYNNLANIAAFVCFEWLLFVLLKHKRENQSKLEFASVAISLIGIGMLISCAHFFVPGYSHSTGARLFLPFATAGAFLTALLFTRMLRVPPWALLTGALVLFGVYHPTAIERRFSNNLILVRSTDTIYSYLAAYADKHVLLITERPGQYTVMGRGAISFKYANNNAVDIVHSLNRKLFTDIVVAQEILYKTELPRQEQQLLPAYRLKPLYEFQNSADTYMRLSVVDKESLPPSGTGAL